MLKSGMKNEAVVKAAEELCEKDLIRLSKLRKKGLPEDLINSILKNSKNFGNYSDEALLLIKSSTKSFDGVLKLIDDYGDDFISAYAEDGDDAVGTFLSIVSEGGSEVLESLSRAQKRNVQTLNNVIENNLKEHDFSGTLRDLQGNPVPKPNGGFWDHKTEMVQSYNALIGVRNGLEGSLKNPNLSPEVSKFLQGELDKTNIYIQKIEDLFAPFGGVK